MQKSSKTIKYPLIISIFLLFAVLVGFNKQAIGQTICYGPDGCTGIGSATAGDVGKFLKVSDDSPFTYTFDSVTAPVWGAITGTLSDQTDLQNALDAKLSIIDATTTYVPYTGATQDINIGAHNFTLGAEGGTTYNILSPSATTPDTEGASIGITLGDGLGIGSGGTFDFIAGTGGETGDGGGLGFQGGTGGNTSGSGGEVLFSGGTAPTDGNGGSIRFVPGAGAGAGVNGKIQFQNQVGGTATLGLDSLTTEQTFTFPDASGTFLLTNGVGSNLTLARIGASTYSTIQHLQNTFHSSGWFSGGGITDDGDGTITVAAGTGTIRATDSDTAEIKFFDWASEAGANVNLTDNNINYIYVEYNAGSPRVIATTTERTDYNTNVLLAVVYRSGTDLHIDETQKVQVINHALQMLRMNKAIMPYAHESGALISETGTRNIALTAGSFWEGLINFTTAAFDSSVAGTFSYYYRDGGGGWTKVASQTQIDNTQYDDGDGGLGTLTANKYGVHWVFMETDGDVSVVYGQDDYILLSSAEDATVPSSLPPQITSTGFIVGKIIIQKSASTFTSIESAFDTTFTSSTVTIHNELSGLQGGTTNEYYHLTSAQNTLVAALDADLATFSLPASTTISAFGASLIDDAAAVNARTTLGLVIGTDVQAYDADLTTWAGITPGTGVATALGVNVGTDGAFVVNGGALGTPSSGTLTNATGLPISTGVSGLGANVATFLGTPSSANLLAAVTDETGTGALVFGTSPTFTTQITAPIVYGSTASGGDLTLLSSSNATKGSIFLGASGTTGYDETLDAFGIGTQNFNAAGGILDAGQQAILHLSRSTNANVFFGLYNGDTGANAAAVFRVRSDSANMNFQAHGSGRTATRFGVTIASYGEFIASSGNGLIIGTFHSAPLILGTNATNNVQINPSGNVKIAGTATRATTEGTNHLDIFNGTAPVGTLTNGVSLYSASGELRVMDAAGNSTLLSPHDEDNFWVFDSEDKAKGTSVHIETEKLLRYVNDYFGLDYVKGYMADQPFDPEIIKNKATEEKRSAEENWQWGVIILLALAICCQQIQIVKIRKKYE